MSIDWRIRRVFNSDGFVLMFKINGANFFIRLESLTMGGIINAVQELKIGLKNEQ